jgi:DNA-binding transcriptional ArsR family regulator
LVSDFGSDEGYLAQKAKFDWIVATTPVFEQHRQLESLLGERFIDLRWIPGNREDMAYRAGTNNPYLESIRTELAADVCSLMERAKTSSFESLLEAEIRIISDFGDKTARLRTPVQRDKLRNLISYPEPEIGTDLTQGFCRLVQGLKALGLTKYGPYINRLLWDCMPKLRSQVLGCLARGETSADNIAKETKLSRRTIEYQLEDLRLLDIIDADNQLLHAIIHM